MFLSDHIHETVLVVDAPVLAEPGPRDLGLGPHGGGPRSAGTRGLGGGGWGEEENDAIKDPFTIYIHRNVFPARGCVHCQQYRLT